MDVSVRGPSLLDFVLIKVVFRDIKCTLFQTIYKSDGFCRRILPALFFCICIAGVRPEKLLKAGASSGSPQSFKNREYGVDTAHRMACIWFEVINSYF